MLVGGLDYETLPDPKQYIIQVQAIDGGTPIPFTVHFQIITSIISAFAIPCI